MHKEQAIAALQAGLFAYCEKPVADTLAGIDEIARAEKASGKRIFYSTARFRGWDGLMTSHTSMRAPRRHLSRGHPPLPHPRPAGRGYQPPLALVRRSSQAIAGITGDMGLYFIDKALYLTGWPKSPRSPP